MFDVDFIDVGFTSIYMITYITKYKNTKSWWKKSQSYIVYKIEYFDKKTYMTISKT